MSSHMLLTPECYIYSCTPLYVSPCTLVVYPDVLTPLAPVSYGNQEISDHTGYMAGVYLAALFGLPARSLFGAKCLFDLSGKPSGMWL